MHFEHPLLVSSSQHQALIHWKALVFHVSVQASSVRLKVCCKRIFDPTGLICTSYHQRIFVKPVHNKTNLSPRISNMILVDRGNQTYKRVLLKGFVIGMSADQSTISTNEAYHFLKKHLIMYS